MADFVRCVRRVRGLGLVNSLAFPAARDPGAARDARGWSADPSFLVPEPLLTIRVGNEDVVVDALVIRHFGKDGNRADRTIIFSGPNGATLRGNLPVLKSIASRCGANVISYDYPGYAGSGGLPRAESCNLAIEAVCRWAVELGLGPIVLVGRSIGSGPTIHLAVHEELNKHVSGVVIWCGFESCASAVAGSLWAYLFRRCDLFRSYAVASSLATPVFIMHGCRDETVPVQNAVAMQSACCHCALKPVFLKMYGHNDMPLAACISGIRQFIEMVDQAQREQWSLELWRGATAPSLAVVAGITPVRCREVLEVDVHTHYSLHPHSWAKFCFFFIIAIFTLFIYFGFQEHIWLWRVGVFVFILSFSLASIWAMLPNCFVPPDICAVVVGVGIVSGLIILSASQMPLDDAPLFLAAALGAISLLLLSVACEAWQWCIYAWRRKVLKAVTINGAENKTVMDLKTNDSGKYDTSDMSVPLLANSATRGACACL